MTYDPVTGEGEEESMAERCLCGHRHDDHEIYGGCLYCSCTGFRWPVTEHPMPDCPWEAA